MPATSLRRSRRSTPKRTSDYSVGDIVEVSRVLLSLLSPSHVCFARARDVVEWWGHETIGDNFLGTQSRV